MTKKYSKALREEVHFRLTESEHAALLKMAGGEKLSKSDMLRALINEGAAKRKIITHEPA